MDKTQTNLLHEVRDGRNADAWDSFYRIYSTLIRNFARRMGLNDADVEDVVQDVLIAVHQALKDNVYDRSRGAFHTWLYGITRRQSLAKLRERHRRTRAQGVAEETGADLLDQIEDTDTENESIALWKQEWRYALLDEALRHVQMQSGEKEYQAFILHAMQKRNAEDVASELGIATASVYVYKRRILTAVREWINHYEPED